MSKVTKGGPAPANRLRLKPYLHKKLILTSAGSLEYISNILRKRELQVIQSVSYKPAQFLSITCRTVIMLLLILGSVFSCSHDAETVLVYPPRSTNSQKVSLTWRAEGKKDHSLALALTVSNPSSQNLLIDCRKALLTTTDGLEATPLKITSTKSNLAPGTTAKIELVYAPINNRVIHQSIRRLGDFRENYLLNTGFILLPRTNQNSNPDALFLPKTIRLTASASDFKDYKEQYGSDEQLRVYDFEYNQATFQSRQMVHLVQEFPIKKEKHGHAHHNQEHSVVASSSEIVVNGAAFEFRFYRIKEKGFLLFKFINRSPHTIAVDASRILLRHDTKSFSPENNFSKLDKRHPAWQHPDSNEQRVFLPPGQRLLVTFRYELPEKAGEYWLEPNGVILDGKSLIKGRFRFRQP